jgi:hypothetical protein
MNQHAIETGRFLIAETRHHAPDGTLYAVRNMGKRRIGDAVSQGFLEVATSGDGGATWSALPLRAFALHALRAQASDWPPPAALASRLVDGALVIEFDNLFDPWAKAPLPESQAHARWSATWRPGLRCWTLRRQHQLSADAAVTR